MQSQTAWLLVTVLLVLGSVALPSSAQDRRLAKLPQWIEQLSDPDIDRRAEAADRIAELGPAGLKAMPILLERLGDNEMTSDGDLVAKHYMRALSQLGPDVVPALLDQLETRNMIRFAGVVEALYLLGPTAAPAVEVILPQLDEVDGTRLWGYVHILEGIGPDAAPAVPWLMKRLEQELPSRDPQSFQLQIILCRALGGIGPPAHPATELLLKIVEDHDGIASVISHAALALGGIGPQEDPRIPVKLAEALEIVQFPIRERILRALGMLGPDAKGALPILETYWNDPRFNAPIELALCRWKVTGDVAPTLERLENLLQTFDKELETIVALGNMGEAARPLLGTLIKKLDSADEDVVYETCYALAKIGDVPPAGLVRLEELSQRDDDYVSRAAQDALQKLR